MDGGSVDGAGVELRHRMSCDPDVFRACSDGYAFSVL